MVGELLDLARIESGQIVMRREVVQLDQLLPNVIERLALRAQESGVALYADIATGCPPSSAMAIGWRRSSVI